MTENHAGEEWLKQDMYDHPLTIATHFVDKYHDISFTGEDMMLLLKDNEGEVHELWKKFGQAMPTPPVVYPVPYDKSAVDVHLQIGLFMYTIRMRKDDKVNITAGEDSIVKVVATRGEMTTTIKNNGYHLI